jgi:ribonuclease BN (tRNA processing enzyme)
MAPTKDQLYLLGTGTPTPTAARFGTASVLRLGDDYLMIDCGPAATHKLVKCGLWPTQIKHLFFTHHHFDHNIDYPCFLLCRWDQSTGREPPLAVYGPPPTREITERLIGPQGAFVADWTARVEAPVSQKVHANRGGVLPRPKPVVDARDIEPGLVLEHHDWRVTAARMHHVEPWLRTLAYRIDGPRGSVVFAADTGPCPALTELARGANVLVVNCWDHQRTMNGNGEAPGQTGTADAARMAREAGARMLVLTHTGPHLCRPGSRERGIADIGADFGGEIIFGEELMVLDLWPA